MLDQDFLYNQVCLFQKTVSSLNFNDTLEKSYSLSVWLHQGEFCLFEKHAVSDWKVKQEYSVPFFISAKRHKTCFLNSNNVTA